MRKKITGLLLVLTALMWTNTTVSAAALPDYQTQEEAEADCDMKITSDAGSTTYMKVCGKNFLYVTVLSGGMLHIVETDPSSFVVTEVTALDADGNELGKVEGVNGILDFSAYDGKTARLHLVTKGYDDYYIEITPEGVPEGFEGEIPTNMDLPTAEEKSGFLSLPWNSILTIGGIVTLCIMVILILLSIHSGYKFAIFGKDKKA